MYSRTLDQDPTLVNSLICSKKVVSDTTGMKQGFSWCKSNCGKYQLRWNQDSSKVSKPRNQSIQHQREGSRSIPHTLFIIHSSLLVIDLQNSYYLDALEKFSLGIPHLTWYPIRYSPLPASQYSCTTYLILGRYSMRYLCEDHINLIGRNKCCAWPSSKQRRAHYSRTASRMYQLHKDVLLGQRLKDISGQSHTGTLHMEYLNIDEKNMMLTNAYNTLSHSVFLMNIKCLILKMQSKQFQIHKWLVSTQRVVWLMPQKCSGHQNTQSRRLLYDLQMKRPQFRYLMCQITNVDRLTICTRLHTRVRSIDMPKKRKIYALCNVEGEGEANYVVP